MRLELYNLSKSRQNAYSVIDVIIFFLLIIIVYVIVQTPPPIKPSYNNSIVQEINVNKDPEQNVCYFHEPIIIKIKNRDYVLSLQASYKISGIVLAKNTFFLLDGGAELSPIDVGLAWGKMAEPEYDKYMSYSSSGRFLQWNYRMDFPFTFDFLNSHVSHNHIIPANENILNAVKSLKIKEKVYIEGYLVNVKSESDNYKFTWFTSLSRYDTSAGACEVFYVNKIQIGNKVYE